MGYHSSSVNNILGLWVTIVSCVQGRGNQLPGCHLGHWFFVFKNVFISAWRLVFWNSIHLEVASGPFCLLLHSPWPLVFALCLFELFLSFVNLYCWKGLHFSWSNSLFFIFIIVGLIFAFHFWFRDLLRELDKKYEVLLICLFLLFFLFLLLKLCYLYPSFGDLFIHYLHQLLGFVLEKVFIFQILVN